MLGYGSLCTIVDRLVKFWQKCLRSIIYSAVARTPPIGVTLSNGRAPALIDRAKLDFRDMREVGGLIVRRECSQGQGSARFARSLTDEVPRLDTYRALLNIRDAWAGGLFRPRG